MSDASFRRLYSLLLCNLLVYAIAALCVRKTIRTEIGFCEAHRKRRWQGIGIGWLLFLGSIGTFIYGAAEESGALLILAVIAFFASFVVWGTMGSTVRAEHIAPGEARVTGCGKAFLESLPPWN